MRARTLEITVGVFIVAGLLSVFMLAMRVSGLSIQDGTADTYRLSANFDNAGSLSNRAKVSMAGVTIGRVVNISLEKNTYMAKVTMDIFSNVDNIPVDSTAIITTSGLLGEKYISISIGGAAEFLVDGETFDDTQSAMVLEDLIGKFLLGSVDSSESASQEGSGDSF